MTELELKIKIIEHFLSKEEEGNETVACYSDLEELTGATKKQIKPILKNLVDNKMIELVSAWDADGEFLRGSGYILTTRATQWSLKEWLLQLKNIKE